MEWRAWKQCNPALSVIIGHDAICDVVLKVNEYDFVRLVGIPHSISLGIKKNTSFTGEVIFWLASGVWSKKHVRQPSETRDFGKDSAVEKLRYSNQTFLVRQYLQCSEFGR